MGPVDLYVDLRPPPGGGVCLAPDLVGGSARHLRLEDAMEKTRRTGTGLE